MKKVLLLLLCLLFITPATINASLYNDNLNKFQVTLPQNWKMFDAEKQIDKDALLEIHQGTSVSGRTLIGIKVKQAKEAHPGLTFATITDQEKSSLLEQTLQKFSANLPEHSSIDTHEFANYGNNTFLVTTINHSTSSEYYKAITAITYYNNMQYTFYLFLNSSNPQALIDFNNMLATFQPLN